MTRILITGASGSGTTTLGQDVAAEIGADFLDADDYYWLPTDPPYREGRDPADRLRMILSDLDGAAAAVVAGSVMEWGAALEDSFTLIVFLYLDAAIRVERLRERETRETGRADPEFLRWAGAYDEGPGYGRSLERHRVWLAKRSCPVITITGELSRKERVDRVRRAMGGNI